MRTAARGQYGPPVTLTLDQGIEARDLYRREHPQVVELWRYADLHSSGPSRKVYL